MNINKRVSFSCADGGNYCIKQCMKIVPVMGFTVLSINLSQTNVGFLQDIFFKNPYDLVDQKWSKYF